ncbi:mediator of RNA polymerase II transcription subunit 15-like [Gadus chalcogrammus]|uniref:mediator of RNA polymerase II transcription subunit 15-like n=1 Tax=Gadus chalcogrammus TaxID=1042646 RepID=UPI0024C22FD6|nr:mediator of RNA polymerase II transcription subunit 15-like [Gadus chalcogrammus]
MGILSSGPTPSPGGFQPSPSPQPSHSPATERTPQNYGVPSPGPLNTPGNPNSVPIMSPAGATSLEDQQYMEKLKQLSKYIEPLRRMINKIDKNEDRKKDLSKMKSLLNILTDPNTRCPLKTLQKCEIALEKLKNDMAVPTPPPPPVATKQQYLCQPLLDAVMTNIRSPVFNHSLYRTFSPAMAAIYGPPITGPSITGRKRKPDEDERQTIPNILQGEVARLDMKFLISLDPSFCSNNGAVHLVCKLDDKNLPSVPPLQLSVPADYPDQSPHWADEGEQYGANSFLQTVHKNMTSKLLQLPDKHSVTELLNTWAQSIRQACLSAA